MDVSSPKVDSATSSDDSLERLRRIDVGRDDQDEIEEEIDEASSSSSSGSDSSSPLGWPLCRRERSHSGASLTSTKSVSSSSLSLNRSFVWEEQQQQQQEQQQEEPEHEEQKQKQEHNQNQKEKKGFAWEEKRDKRETSASEVELMKERFAKLLLGEDMSGGAKGVCTALAISNAITNLAASVFGELWRLEPLAPERKSMWRREMEWLLSVSDYIVELVPSWQSFRDGSNLEVMIARPRSDIHINLPALRKLDAMLLDSLDSYKETDFWYVEQGIEREESNSGTSCSSGSGSSNNSNRKHSLQRQEEKWWLPTPRVPGDGGLSDESRKSLQNQRDCNSQILKAAMAINGQVLSEMEVPDTFWDALPKNGKSCLGEHLYRGLTADKFSPDALLQQFDLSTEHSALEAANRIEAAIHVWQRKIQHQQMQQQHVQHQQPQHQNHQHLKHNAKSSWGKVKEFVTEIDRPALIERAESLLLSLKQRFPGLPQTALDMHKIQYNRDVGQSILESYSRVLESLAFNILARIDDVLFIDDAAKQNRASLSAVSRTPPRSSNTAPPAAAAAVVSSTNLATKNRRLIPSAQFHLVKTPNATPFGSPNCSPPPAPVDSPKKTNSPTRLGKAADLSNLAYVVKRPAKQAPAPVATAPYNHHHWKRSYARNLECSRNLVSPPGRD